MIEIVSLLFLSATTVFGAAVNPECGSMMDPIVLTNFTGTITSPGYYSNKSYETGLLCQWKIRSAENYRIHITFNDLDLDEVNACAGDFVSIDIFNSVLKVCGKVIPNDIVVNSSQVFIVFKSDYVYSGRGFSLTYKFTSKTTVCGNDEFQCRNRKCVSLNTLCDGDDNCEDGSDEEKCARAIQNKVHTCGTPAIQPELKQTFRVLGGNAAVEGSWPWQADLQVRPLEPNGHNCGGALINNEYVLTAAHCFLGIYQKEQLRIIFGNYGKFKTTGYEQVRYVKNFMTYPNNLNNIGNLTEDIRDFDLKDDIGLIRLSSPVKFTERVQPVCLPSPGFELELGMQCVATGWGQTRGTGNSGILKQLLMEVVNATECRILVRLSVKKLMEYPDTKICVSSKRFENGICSGDSGGPLVYNNNNKWYLVGLASHLSASSAAGPICGLGIGESFAKVSHKIDWIEKTMKALEVLD